MPYRLLFRTDASQAIGTGHVMRCLALARAAEEDGAEVHFLVAELPEFLRAALEERGITHSFISSAPYGMDDAEELLAAAKDMNAAWIILDGYSFDRSYRKALLSKGPRVLVLQDFGSDYDTADVILNQNIGAQGSKTDTHLLLGPRFALLRPEFAERKEKLISKKACNILVTLGGADPSNVTGEIMDALKDVPSSKVTIVIGGAHPARQALQAKAKAAGFDCIVNASNMHHVMANADIAIASGGTTTYELACMGIPMLLTVLAENQRNVAREWERAGAAINLGWHEDLSKETILKAVRNLQEDCARRKIMAESGQKLVDGYGALRVHRELRGDPLWLRSATVKDCMQIFTWANDEETRAASFSSTPISEEEHVRWYKEKISSPQDRLFMAIDDQEHAVGLVRFTFEKKHATISVNLGPQFRGKGFGTALITQGCRQIFATTDIETIDAFIKPENVSSKKSFAKAMFREAGDVKIRGESALHMVLPRSTIDA